MIERIKEHLEFHQAIDTHKSDVAFLTELLAWIEAKDQLIAELQQERDELAEKLRQGHEFVKETGRMLESERHKPFWSWHIKRKLRQQIVVHSVGEAKREAK